MKANHVLPLFAIAAMSASFAAHAQDNNLMPTFYGRINVEAVLNMPDKGGSDSELVSNASRLGLKGDFAISEGLKVFYQAEYQLNPEEGLTDGQFFSQRNSYVGLAGGFGEVLVGRNDTPSKQLQNKIDLFNDLDGDIKYLFPAENRIPDVIYYTSPTISGFTLSYSAILSNKSSLDDRLTEDNSASLTYEKDNFYAGVSVDRDIKSYDTVRFVTQYTMGELQLGALYETSEKSGSARGEQDGIFVSAAYTFNNYVFKAQTGVSDEKSDNRKQHSFGVDYNYNSDLKTFATYTMTRADGSAQDRDQVGLGVQWSF